MFKPFVKLIFIITLFFSYKAIATEILKVGASSAPHAEILEAVKPILSEKGIKLKIIIFQDYIMANKALFNKDLDANYYQHIAFLNKQNKDFGYNLVNLGSIHIEPIGLYSKRYKHINEIPEGTTVIMSNSIADRARVLNILEELKLIKLKSTTDTSKLISADIKDIVSNPKKLKFRVDIQPSLVPKAYLNNDAGLIFINTNYAISANINPKKEALYLEKVNKSLYANILVARNDNYKDIKIHSLLAVLHSQVIRNFILNKYNGLVIPLF